LESGSLVISQVISIANVAALLGIVAVGYRIVRHLTRMELMVDLMWSDFRKRFPFSRSTDEQPS